MQIQEAIAQFHPFTGTRLSIEGIQPQPLVVNDPTSLEVTLAEGAEAKVVICHTKPHSGEVQMTLAKGSRLTLVEYFGSECVSSVTVRQQAKSALHLTSVELAAATARYTIDLVGREALCEVGGLFLVGESEQSSLTLRTNHLVSDCQSNSVVRGIAGGKAVGRFEGMVYVAQDAQRTDAGQQNRNMLLSPTARIETMPQLEIYADDVKCSHGATVGQMDNEAIYYMRQRGLNEQQARALQIRGFAAEVLMHCGVEPLCEAMLEAMEQKIERL